MLAAVVILVASVLWTVVPKGTEEKGEANGTPTTIDALSSQQGVNQTATSANSQARNIFEGKVAAFMEVFGTPIEFFGQVIDQHGNPIPNTTVKMLANDKALGTRSSEYERTTDSDGRFSLRGAKGITLGVSVSKAGYRVFSPVYGNVTSSGVFEYGLSSRKPHQSSKDDPTVFTLYAVGILEPLVKVGERNFRIARDGTPLSISLDGQGGHPVVLRCWNQVLNRSIGQRLYDWRLEITVPGGGLTIRNDEFAFEAPVEGYMPIDTVDMPISLGDKWRDFAQRSYFIRYEDETFARVNLRMRPGGDHFVVWESYYNPKVGSRNLESEQ